MQGEHTAIFMVLNRKQKRNYDKTQFKNETNVHQKYFFFIPYWCIPDNVWNRNNVKTVKLLSVEIIKRKQVRNTRNHKLLRVKVLHINIWTIFVKMANEDNTGSIPTFTAFVWIFQIKFLLRWLTTWRKKMNFYQPLLVFQISSIIIFSACWGIFQMRYQ